MAALVAERTPEGDLPTAPALGGVLHARFGITADPRSIARRLARYLERQEKTSPTSPPAVSPSRDDYVTAYERLRLHVVSPTAGAGAGSLGLARLLQEGLPGWPATVATLGLERPRGSSPIEPGLAGRDLRTGPLRDPDHHARPAA